MAYRDQGKGMDTILPINLYRNTISGMTSSLNARTPATIAAETMTYSTIACPFSCRIKRMGALSPKIHASVLCKALRNLWRLWISWLPYSREAVHADCSIKPLGTYGCKCLETLLLFGCCWCKIVNFYVVIVFADLCNFFTFYFFFSG